ncbi:MAG: tetratricopeptide repeat protein, partial [Planctomycetota bacterium]
MKEEPHAHALPAARSALLAALLFSCFILHPSSFILSIALVSAQQPSEAGDLTAAEREELHKRRQTRMAEAHRFRQEGKLAEAAEAAEGVLELERQLFGDAHPALVDTLLWLAQTHAAGANFAQAEAQYRRALDICWEVFGPKDPNSLACLNNLAGLYHAKGDYARAEPLLREVLEA